LVHISIFRFILITITLALPVNFLKDDEDTLNIFDEQGTGLLKTMSEKGKDNPKYDHKKNEKAIEINKSFDSRKTSVHGDRIINDSSKTNLSGFNTDRKKRYNDIDNLSLFTLKDWKDSKIYDWY
jgi:hypothetical protein